LYKILNYDVVMTPRQIKFARLYFEHGDAVEAYSATHDTYRVPEADIKRNATAMANRVAVREYVAKLQEDAAFAATLTVSWLVRQHMQIATADVNELVESRRNGCRHCHGINHEYQWIDQNEWAEALAAVMDANHRAELAATPKNPARLKPLPTDAGGYGYWASHEPVATCPKCFGMGEHQVFIKDSRKLSANGRLLYQGIKTTGSGGIEVKMRDQNQSLQFLAKFLRIDGDGSPADNQNPVRQMKAVSEITNDPVEASRFYTNLISGNVS
jgi:phage terminase small subunit